MDKFSYLSNAALLQSTQFNQQYLNRLPKSVDDDGSKFFDGYWSSQEKKFYEAKS